MTTATAFKQAAEKQDAAVFDYAHEVEQVWRDFPETKDKVFFFDIGTQKIVYPGDPQKQRELHKRIDNKEDLLSDQVEMYSTVKASCCYPCGKASNSDAFILLFPSNEEKRNNLLAKTATIEQETIFVFDHELGHAIITDGRRPSNQGECIADAYAVIRHLQRYGAESTVIEALPLCRIFKWFAGIGDRDHFTSPVTEQILARRHDFEWNILTPEETKQLAWRFALKYAMPFEQLNFLTDVFFDAKLRPLQKGDVTLFKKLAEEVLSTAIPDVFKWGTAVLKLALDGHLSKTHGITLIGEHWQNIRQQLAEKQKTFSQQGELLFGLGAADRPLRRSAPNNVIHPQFR